MTHVLVPATYEKSVVYAKIVKHVCWRLMMKPPVIRTFYGIMSLKSYILLVLRLMKIMEQW